MSGEEFGGWTKVHSFPYNHIWGKNYSLDVTSAATERRMIKMRCRAK